MPEILAETCQAKAAAKEATKDGTASTIKPAQPLPSIARVDEAGGGPIAKEARLQTLSLTFLYNGKCRALKDRLLPMRLAPSFNQANREVSFEFLNRETSGAQVNLVTWIDPLEIRPITNAEPRAIQFVTRPCRLVSLSGCHHFDFFRQNTRSDAYQTSNSSLFLSSRQVSNLQVGGRSQGPGEGEACADQVRDPLL